MNVCYVRHGETDWNKERRYQGREDVPLNGEGRAHARAAGEALSRERWDIIVTSPLSRAAETARVIAGSVGVKDIIYDDALMERDYGEGSGLTYEEARGRYDGPVPGREEDASVAARMMAALERITAAYPGKNVIAVSHGGAINMLVRCLAPEDLTVGRTLIHNGGMTLITHSPEKGYNLEFYNKAP